MVYHSSLLCKVHRHLCYRTKIVMVYPSPVGSSAGSSAGYRTKIVMVYHNNVSNPSIALKLSYKNCYGLSELLDFKATYKYMLSYKNCYGLSFIYSISSCKCSCYRTKIVMVYLVGIIHEATIPVSYRTKIVMVYQDAGVQGVIIKLGLSYKNCYGLSHIQKWNCAS